MEVDLNEEKKSTKAAAVVCPKCRSVAVREIAIGKRLRVECVGCGRFAGWIDQKQPIALPERSSCVSGVVEEIEQSKATQWWLYVSKRLDLIEVPNTAPWRVLAFTYGRESPVAFYRLTPQVVVWLDSCGMILERQVLAGESPRSTLDDYLRHMDEIWRFASLNLDVEKVRAARMEPASLPPVHGGPI